MVGYTSAVVVHLDLDFVSEFFCSYSDRWFETGLFCVSFLLVGCKAGIVDQIQYGTAEILRDNLNQPYIGVKFSLDRKSVV